MELLVLVVHRCGTATGRVALALQVEDLLPIDRRGQYWRSLCDERWPGKTHPRHFKSRREIHDEDFHKQLYLSYRVMDLFHSGACWGTEHIESETLLVEQFVTFIKLESVNAVMHAPLLLLQHLENLELERCRLGRATCTPGPIEKLADTIGRLPRLERLGMARNDLSDANGLFLMSALRYLPRMKTLDLTWNRLTDTCLQEGISLLIRDANITTIHLFGNDFSAAGRSACLNAVKELNQRTKAGKPRIEVRFLS